MRAVGREFFMHAFCYETGMRLRHIRFIPIRILSCLASHTDSRTRFYSHVLWGTCKVGCRYYSSEWNHPSRTPHTHVLFRKQFARPGRVVRARAGPIKKQQRQRGMIIGVRQRVPRLCVPTVDEVGQGCNAILAYKTQTQTMFTKVIYSIL
jgi:hypothetical protein